MDEKLSEKLKPFKTKAEGSSGFSLISNGFVALLSSIS